MTDELASGIHSAWDGTLVNPRSESVSEESRGYAMQKSLVIVLSDQELLDLYRVLIDRDADGALAFLDHHVRKKVHQALEGG